jgi:hypothetical protein
MSLSKHLGIMWRMIVERPAFIGLCIVAAAEAVMNATFGYAYYGGEGQVALIMAAALFGNEMVKWQAADGVGEALREGQRVRAGIWAVVLIACVSISLPAHIGFIGMYRNDNAAKREAVADIKTSTRGELVRKEEDLGKLGPQRPVATVEADIAKECKSGRGPRCLTLEAELGSAKRAVELDAEIKALRSERRSTASVGVADPQSQVLGWFWSADEEKKKMTLAIMLAIAMEIMTSLGFIAVGQGGRSMIDYERAMADGAMTGPAAEHVVPFRTEVLENRPGAGLTADALWDAYQSWCRARGRQEIQRVAFLRLIEACGVRREGSMFMGVGLKAARAI